MSIPKKKSATYEELEQVPDHLVAEILDTRFPVYFALLIEDL